MKNFISFRHRFLIAFCVIHLILLAPVLVIIRYSTNKIYNSEIKETMKAASQTAGDITDFVFARLRQDQQRQARLYLMESEFLTFAKRYFNKQAGKKDLSDYQASYIHTRFNFDGLYLFDRDKQLIAIKTPSSDAFVQRMIRDSAMIDNALSGRPSSVIALPDRLILSAEPVYLSDGNKGALLSVNAMPAAFSRSYETKQVNDQAYQSLIKDLKKTKRQIWYTGIITIVVIFSLHTTLWIWFWRHYTKPLNELHTGLEALSRGQKDFSLKAGSFSDEYRIIISHIETMLHNFSDQQNRLLYLEKMALWKDIAQQLAHEIKNPLTPIQLTIQQIRDAYRGDDEAYKNILTECSHIILEEIQRLRSLTKEFSDFARSPNLLFRPHDLNKIIDEIIRFYQSQEITFIPDPEIPKLEIDRDAIKQVIINLLDNALHAAAAGILISIATKNSDEFVTMTIRDNGKGIPKEFIPRIFEPYYTTKSASAGLGLAIVKNILEEHKASIDVDSIENLGTTFTIRFRKMNPLLS